MDSDTQELQEQLQQALNKAFFYLKFRPRSEKEVTDYLKKKAERYFWPASVISGAIQILKEKNFVNDDSFVEWFINQRSSGKPKSSYALTQELQRFGIHRDITSKFLEENPLDEENLAYGALRRRWRRYEFLEKKERFQKSAMFLSSRGFGFEIIKKIINRLENGSLEEVV